MTPVFTALNTARGHVSKMIPMFTGRVGHEYIQHGPTGVIFDTRVDGPCPRPVNTSVILDTRTHGP